MDLKSLNKRKTIFLIILSLIFLLSLFPLAESRGNHCLEIESVGRTVSGNEVTIRPLIVNECSEFTSGVELVVGSESKGYESTKISLDPYEDEVYSFEFILNQKEMFKVSLISSITDEEILEPRYIELEPRPTLENEDKNVLISFLLNNITIIIGIIIITIIGVILITPFIHDPKDRLPFKGEVTLEELKD